MFGLRGTALGRQGYQAIARRSLSIGPLLVQPKTTKCSQGLYHAPVVPFVSSSASNCAAKGAKCPLAKGFSSGLNAARAAVRQETGAGSMHPINGFYWQRPGGIQGFQRAICHTTHSCHQIPPAENAPELPDYPVGGVSPKAIKHQAQPLLFSIVLLPFPKQCQPQPIPSHNQQGRIFETMPHAGTTSRPVPKSAPYVAASTQTVASAESCQVAPAGPSFEWRQPLRCRWPLSCRHLAHGRKRVKIGRKTPSRRMGCG